MYFIFEKKIRFHPSQDETPVTLYGPVDPEFPRVPSFIQFEPFSVLWLLDV